MLYIICGMGRIGGIGVKNGGVVKKSGEKIWSCRKKVVTLHSQLRDWQRDAICREGRSVENRHRGVEQW